MTRSRALDAVGAVFRQLGAEAAAAGFRASATAALRTNSSAALACDTRDFNVITLRSAFDCATSAARRTRLNAVDALLALDVRLADESAREAQVALLPWAQMRRGLERLRARRTANAAS